MKKFVAFFLSIITFSTVSAQNAKWNAEHQTMLNRLLSYLKIESQSVDDPNPASFPLTDGQRAIARHIYNEVKSFGGKNVKVTLSDDSYLYIDIPSNLKGKSVPSILFLAHMDVTPEANGKDIMPQVHYNYDGGDLVLSEGVTLSPNTPQGTHLKDLVGKTIVTSDGTTLLGADDKTGCAILISLAQNLIKNPKIKHGRVMISLSQNEDVGKAALCYQPEIFEERPDIVVDVDGDTHDKLSVANFSAEAHIYTFRGNLVHPSHGKENRYADAMTAACYFIGLLPPKIHPSASEGKEGYVHCYAMAHPTDELNHPIDSDYELRIRLRYFNKKDGERQRQLLADNLQKTREAFPFVECSKTYDVSQYENIAYSMPKCVPSIIQKAALDGGIEMHDEYARGGTTSAMMVARFPKAMPGGCCIYSGQNAEHSVYEWCCIEELDQLVTICKNIITECTKINKKILNNSQEKEQLPTQELRKLPHGVD